MERHMPLALCRRGADLCGVCGQSLHFHIPLHCHNETMNISKRHMEHGGTCIGERRLEINLRTVLGSLIS